MPNQKGSIMDPKIVSLMEELIMLDEIAGELDPESNARIDEQRKELKAKIIELESENA